MPDQFIVTDARREDVPQLTTLITQLGYLCTADEMLVRFDNISQNPDYRTLVIADGDALIGMAGLVKGFWYEKNGTYMRIIS